jgi:hypothetical protein
VRVADYSGSALPTTTAFDICVVSAAPLAPCDMSAEDGLWPFLSVTPDAGGALTTINTAQFEGSEYSVLTGIVSGNFYQVEHTAGSYITVREGTVDGPVLTSGFALVAFTAASTSDLYVHWTLDEFCAVGGTAGSFLTTVQDFGLPPCDMSSEDGQYPVSSITADAGGAVTNISTAQFAASEYSVITGLLDAHEYEFTHAAGSYITVRIGAVDGPLLGSGFSPLMVQTSSTADLFVHWTVDAACTVDGTGIFLTTVQDFGLLPCDMTSVDGQWPASSITPDAGGALTTISTNNFGSGEYSVITGLASSSIYEFTHADGSYITVRVGAVDGTVLGAGYSPLSVTALTADDLYVHWTADEFCSATSAGVFLTTVQFLGVACIAEAGTLITAESQVCFPGALVAVEGDAPVVPVGYVAVYVVTDGAGNVVDGPLATPEYTPTAEGTFVMHTMVLDPNDQGTILAEVANGAQAVADLFEENGGALCGSLDLNGVTFTSVICPDNDDCADAITIECGDALAGSTEFGTLSASVTTAGIGVWYSFEGNGTDVTFSVCDAADFDTEITVLTGANCGSLSTVDDNDDGPGCSGFSSELEMFTEFGTTYYVYVSHFSNFSTTTGTFTLSATCNCTADAGTLAAVESEVCLVAGSTVEISATEATAPVAPVGYSVLYVLTSNPGLIIEAVNTTPEFTITAGGEYTIHTLVYNPATLDLSVVVFGTTAAQDVLDIVGANEICAALDVTGAPITVNAPEVGATTADATSVCLDGGSADIGAESDGNEVVPAGYTLVYVLTDADNGLEILDANATGDFTVNAGGNYIIHTFVYDPAAVPDLAPFVGQSATVVVAAIGDGSVCAALDVTGAPITVTAPEAGTLTAGTSPICLTGGSATVTATPNGDQVVPAAGYATGYALTEAGVVTQVGATASFDVDAAGDYTIHTFIYPVGFDPADAIGVPAATVNGLLVQGGGALCASLDLTGATITVDICTGINEALLSNLAVYPNPSNGQFVVEVNGVDADAQITVMDIAGRHIYTESVNMNGNFRKELNMNIASGTYLLQINTVEGKVTRKIQIN